MPPPSQLLTRPKLHEDLEEVWNAWWHLNQFRQLGGLAPSPLSHRDALDWVEILGVPANDRARWMRLLGAMEATWSEWIAAKVGGRSGGDPGTGSAGPTAP